MTVSDTTTPWHPMTDPVALKTLGKLSEEIAEAITELLRFESVFSGRFEQSLLITLYRYLEEEFGDVLANIELTCEKFDLKLLTLTDISMTSQQRIFNLLSLLADLSRIVARTIIQGLDGIDPRTEYSNREMLTNHLTMVRSRIQFSIEPFKLNVAAIHTRRDKKLAYLRPLHAKA